MPKFDVEVQLSGEDGNSFAIMGRVIRGLREAGATKTEISQYQLEAMAGSYDELLATSMKWVNVQ